MYEYTCPVCGKVTQVEKSWLVRTYCSQSCASKDREKKRAEIDNMDTVGECIFLPEAVMCYKRDCVNCGWNPVVAKARLERIRACLAKPEPESPSEKTIK
jgi:hypothetical protein